jgi:hypothetical protein
LVGLSEHEVGNVSELLFLMSKAHGLRSVGSTGANMESSRSHQIMQLVLREQVPTSSVPVSVGAGRRRVSVAPVPKTIGKLSFIDLAGSERGADTTHNSKQVYMYMYVYMCLYMYVMYRFISIVLMNLMSKAKIFTFTMYRYICIYVCIYTYIYTNTYEYIYIYT